MARRKGRNRAYRAIAGIVAVLVLAVLALLVLVDIGKYRPMLETEASRVLGLDVRIRGEMDIDLFPPVGISLADIHATRRGADVIRAERMRAGLQILPLLLGRIRLREVELVRPQVFIRRTGGGPFDFDRYLSRPFRSVREALPGNLEGIERLSVSGGMISYASRDGAFRADVEGLVLGLREIAFRGPPGADPFRNVSFSGNLMAERIVIGAWEGSALACKLAAKDGNYEIESISLRAFGGTGEGSVWINLAVPTPLLHVRFSQTGSDIGPLTTPAGGEPALLEGRADLSVNLFMKGDDPDAVAGTMAGDISWEGTDLRVPGFDPDALLESRRKDGGVPLARIAALFLPVPFCPAAVAGLSGPDAAPENREEEGRIGTLVSRWTITDGVFEAEDAALAVKSRRVALTGRIDLPNGRFDNVTVAQVDEKGCATAGQTIRGDFPSPRIAEASTPPAGKCEVFYAGSVPPAE